MIHAFQPIVSDKPTVLILGSMPSVRSLGKSQYYGHPRNAFWPILFSLFQKNLTDDYEKRMGLIKENSLALWDVLSSCEREGSLDADIKNEEPNDFITFLSENETVRCIAFNGGKAEALFKKHFQSLYEDKHYTFIRLPSTSPAYTLKFEKKLEHWQALLEYIQ